MWFRLQPNSKQPAGGTCHGVAAMHATREAAAAVADAEALGAAQYGPFGASCVAASPRAGPLQSCKWEQEVVQAR